MIYYNENNLESAAMIRQFMADGLIPHGEIDTRSITEVTPDDLKDYTQCHFFAGIAGWTFALQLAGWPSDRPVWTGSPPCQPFSSAGKQKGKDDERHLLPIWLKLICKCRPATIFGEQVASSVAHGWLDDVYQGLEAENYAVGAAVLPACSVGAPHQRNRLWFVAHANDKLQQPAHNQTRGGDIGGYGKGCINVSVADPVRCRPQRQGTLGQSMYPAKGENGKTDWSDDAGTGVWVECPDRKSRLVEPSIPLLANGVQFRRPILHALGNAIHPKVGAAFIKASM